MTFFMKIKNVVYTSCQLSNEHIKLSPYSTTNVRLAVQVLSSTVSKVLLAYGPPKAAETACFCSLMNCLFFFDILNIRNMQSHEFERKPMLVPFPFTSVNDPRF